MEVLEEINNAEIMQRAMDDFREVQDFMALAKKENAIETYARLKRKYTTLKGILPFRPYSNIKNLENTEPFTQRCAKV